MGFRNSFLRIGCALCCGCLLLSGPFAYSQAAAGGFASHGRGRGKTPQDVGEAIGWAQEALAKDGYRNIDINSQYVLFGDDKGKYGIALGRLVSTSSEFSGGVIRIFWQDYAHDQPEAAAFYNYRQAEKLAAALNFLAANARQEATTRDAQELAQFHSRAQAWREAATKPTMPEEGREHQVLAEFAFKEKNVDKAVGEYTSALSVFPTWPEGQYNLATLAGEKKLYAVAILHMKEYLELSPESADAQAAKDAIIIWRDKLDTVLANSAIGPEVAQTKGRRY